MGLFDTLLHDDESVFKNPFALEYDFQPKLVPFREDVQQTVASCIAPLLQKRNGRHIVLFGKPGLGKTVCARHVLAELEETTDSVFPLYVNCWKKDTPFKVVCALSEQLGYTFTHNKNVDELMQQVAKLANKTSVVIVLDEIDKLTDHDILYTLLEDIYRKSLILITHDLEYLVHLDDRIRSRLCPDTYTFEPYTVSQVATILHQRVELAFFPTVWHDDAFDNVVLAASSLGDIRTGLFLLRHAGDAAESKSKRTIDVTCVAQALSQLDNFSQKKIQELAEEQQVLLTFIKQHSGISSGDLFALYQEQGYGKSYKTFQRQLKNLERARMIFLHEENKGNDGRTTIISFRGVKTLQDYSGN